MNVKLILNAAALAKKWHEGQVHTFGNASYFDMHLKPIADIVKRLGYGSEYVAVAYLHDIKEDTSITDDELLTSGIPKDLVDAINILAKKDSQSHEEYLAAILTNPISTVVKYCDSSFNFASTILNSADINDEYFKRRSAKYAHNIATLEPKLPKPF